MPGRMRVSRPLALRERVMLSSAGSSATTAGALASQKWLRTLGLTPPLKAGWHAELELTASTFTRFHVEITDSEWGFLFEHEHHSSWIRVTEIPFVHDRDDYKLLHRTPPLRDIGYLVRELERDHQISFRRTTASVHTDLPGLVPEAIRWLARF
jgi:hypothetical protein